MEKKGEKYVKNFKYHIVLFLCCLLLVGCAQTRILERISLVTLIGYDLIEENKVTSTSVIRQINPEFESRVEIQTETEDTSKGTRIKVDMKTAKTLAAGQLRVVLFGEELAKKGIEQPIHTLMMNNEVSTSIYLAVAKGTSQSLIEYPYKDISDIGQHIYNLMNHNIKQQQAISSTSHEIVRDNYSKIRNFALPILNKEDEFIQLDGIAFFRLGKMVGELSEGDIAYVMMLRGDFDNGTVEMPLDGKMVDETIFKDKPLLIAVDSIRSKRSIKVADPEANVFDIKIKIDCRLLEVDSSLRTDDPVILEKIEKAMNKKIKSELTRVLDYSKEIDSDIYGFGEQYAAQVRNANLTEEKWSEMYKNMKVNIDVDVEIIRNGVFE